LLRSLKEADNKSLDFVILITGSLQDNLREIFIESIRCLKDGGLLFVQGLPDRLPEMGVFLEQFLKFKYWIAVESLIQQPSHGLPSVHAGILLFTKGNGRFDIQRVRFPHEVCKSCGRPLRDWGGKSHLRHPGGFAISDVWKNLLEANNYTQISRPVLNTILKMVSPVSTFDGQDVQANFSSATSKIKGLIGPREGIGDIKKISDVAVQYKLPGFEPRVTRPVPSNVKIEEFWNVVHQGDALEVLRQYPDNSVDLVFADPPYNLEKSYNIYDDEQSANEYLDWCNSWLAEYVRVLKPTGSLYVLNLPRWAMYHAKFLNQHLYFQNWIVWDALSEPRGKLMPAHYALLFCTKSPENFTFNLEDVSPIDSRHYCLRSSCIRERKLNGQSQKEPLTDIWWDIHRLKHRRDRDYHPCQLPDGLLERIIRLSTNPGDIVLDALAGTGTTAVVAARLGRRYVAIDIDPVYVNITRQKIDEVTRLGFVVRQSTRKAKLPYTKKALQLELRDLAAKLGRLPTPDDVEKKSRYGLAPFIETFPSWGKALKAAKLEIENGRNA
jgi:site-specific DNA-methyltransferase (adenine-specific)